MDDDVVNHDSDEPIQPPLRVMLVVDEQTARTINPVLRHICIGLIEQACDVTVVYLGGGDFPNLPSPPVSLIRCRGRFGRLPSRRVLRRLETMLDEHVPDIIHGFNGPTARTVGQLAHLFDRPYMLTILGSSERELPDLVDEQRCQGLIAASQPIADALARTLPDLADRVHVIRIGTPVPAKAARTFTEPDTMPSIVSIGYFEPDSGYETLVEALVRLGNRGLHPMLFLIGRGSQEVKLRKIVSRHESAGRLTITPLPNNWKDILLDADIYIHPGKTTAISVPLLTAAASGLAIVAAEGIPDDFIIHGHTALAYPPARITDLTDCIGTLLADPEQARQLGSNCREYVRTHHSLSAMVAAYLDLYNQFGRYGRVIPLSQ